jgi:hypothetical protein
MRHSPLSPLPDRAVDFSREPFLLDYFFSLMINGRW